MRPEPAPTLPRLEELLISGGDARMSLNTAGMNKYGCFATPQPGMLSYSSSTASTISEVGYAACEQLYGRLEKAFSHEPVHATYAREMERVRSELVSLCECDSIDGLEIVFGASGTDLHLFAAQLCAGDKGLLVIMPEASETGTGVKAALEGRHFSTCSTFGSTATAGGKIEGSAAIDVASIHSRFPDGTLRSESSVDAEVEARVAEAAKTGTHVLLTLTDVSKTGVIIPSVACAIALKRRYPDTLDVLVDACQFRLAPPTLCAYLDYGCMVAMTGSKCITGPAFCGALLVPQDAAQRLREHTLPAGLAAYSCHADWPQGWKARNGLPATANYGLLLRFEAALAELRAFHALPQQRILPFVQRFAQAIQERLEHSAAFVPLATRAIQRQGLVSTVTWDQVPTIFPFLLRNPSTGMLLNREKMQQAYANMQLDLGVHGDIPNAQRDIAALRCLPGQPVACGEREGVAVSALRISLDMRLTVDALSKHGCGTDAVIADALRVLDKAALLAQYMP
jgi:hypothetical protein